MPNPGKLFIFEGVDAAGKSTIAAEFLRSLEKRGLPARSLSFPGKTLKTLGELVYRVHHNPNDLGITSLTAASLQTLHIAAHLDAIETTIVPSLENGEHVILDRFWWSTWAYGFVEGIKLDVLNALVEVEKQAWGKWQPDCVFYVTRKQTLRPEMIDKWKQLKDSYQNIVNSEAGKYPIQVILNETSVDAALDAALSHVRELK